MNERIKELAEQAENYAYSAVVGGSECQEAFIKKFAELIVQECISALWNEVDTNSGFTKSRDLASTGESIIKQHFGVE